MVLSRMANTLACYFSDNGIIQADETDLYAYGLELLLSSVLELVAVLALSVAIGKLIPTLLFLSAFCVLRTYAGGYHADTHFRCFLTLLSVYAVFLLSYTAISRMHRINVFYILSAMSAVSESLVIIFAPVDSENKPLTIEETKKYRKASIRIATVQTLLAVMGALLFSSIIYTLFAFSFGQLAAATSLAAVKIKDSERDIQYGIIEKHDG